MTSELEWLQLQEELCGPPVLLNARQILNAAEAEAKFLVNRRIPAAAITMLTGGPGSMKSWLAYDLAIAVASGRGEWLGAELTPSSWSALILNYDNPTAECGRRLLRLGLQEDMNLFVHSSDFFPLRFPKETEKLRAIASKIQPSIIVVDSLRQAATADENDSREMAEVMAGLKSLISVTGAAVIVIHHLTKASKGVSATARGSGEIEASTDCGIMIDQGEMLWTKTRSWAFTDIESPTLMFRVGDYGSATKIELVGAEKNEHEK